MSGSLVLAVADTGDVLAFHLHLDLIGVVVAAAVGYEYSVRRLARFHAPRGEPTVTLRQRILFYTGLISVVAVSGWPVHDIGERSLYAVHMVEHLTLTLVAPPLLLWGTPWWLIRLLVRPVMPVLRLVTRPLVALVLFNAAIAVSHVPTVVEAMVTSQVFHFLAHGALFVTAILMWWPVVSPIPDLPRLAPFQKMGYLFLQSLVPTVPASFLTLGTVPLYPIYETFPRLWGLDALTDQIIGGLIMKIGGGLILWGFIAGVFFTWWAEEQRYTRPARVVRSAP